MPQSVQSRRYTSASEIAERPVPVDTGLFNIVLGFLLGVNPEYIDVSLLQEKIRR